MLPNFTKFYQFYQIWRVKSEGLIYVLNYIQQQCESHFSIAVIHTILVAYKCKNHKGGTNSVPPPHRNISQCSGKTPRSQLYNRNILHRNPKMEFCPPMVKYKFSHAPIEVQNLACSILFFYWTKFTVNCSEGKVK